MSLRIIDDSTQLDAALTALKNALRAWAGGVSHQWRAESALERARDGESYARRDDLHLYVEKSFDRAVIGVALTERDDDLLRLEFMRDAPGRRKRRLAIAADEAGHFFLLLSLDLLGDQDIRDPLKRLVGASNVRRAELGGRDYVLIGPLDSPRVADALAATGGLAPKFERHVARLGALIADEDEHRNGALYPVSRDVARAHKVEQRVVAALHEKLAAASYRLDGAGPAPLQADFAMGRGGDKLAFEIRGHAEISDMVRGLGQLALAAPAQSGRARVLVLPAPLVETAAPLEAFASALEELRVSVLFYDIVADRLGFALHRADATLSAEARAALV